MKILRRLIYVFFILLLLLSFVFFGGGSKLVRVGQKMEEWELAMKKGLGVFCQQGQKRIKAKADKVTGKLTKSKNIKE